MTNGRFFRSGNAFRGMLTVSLVLLVLLAVASCRTSEGSPAVTLEFAFETPMNVAGEFSETDSMVVRSTLLVENERGITISPTKSKDAKISTLIFIEPADSRASVTVVCVPATSKEYEYDIARAKIYAISSASASEVARVYGIPYSDWQTGIANNSDKFPCCQ